MQNNMNFTRSNNWKMVKLGDVAEVIPGYAFRGEDFGDTGVPIVKITEIQPPYVSFEKSKKVEIEKYNSARVAKYKLKKGDYVVAMTGATIGKVGKIVDDVEAYLNQRVAKIQAKENSDNKFVYYQVFSDKFFKYIQQVSAGSSAQQNVSGTDIEKFEIAIPESLHEQREVAGVLGCLDDKIELLRKENKTLEEIAQTLFKEWFVNFNFPGSTGKLIDSELGKIPEGWRVGKLGEVVEVKGGTTPSTTNADFWNGDIYWTSPKDLSDRKDIFLLGTEKKITDEGLKEIGSGLLPVGTLLLSSRAPIGYLAIANIKLAINQGYIAMPPGSKFSNYFMYLWIKDNMQDIIGAANGSTFLEISKTSFKNLDCTIATDEVFQKFSEVITPQFEKIKNNVLEIQTLSKLRDDLLSKIFSN